MCEPNYVWVVEKSIPCEGDRLIGVASSEEIGRCLAEADSPTQEDMPWHDWHFNPEWDYWYYGDYYLRRVKVVEV